MMDNDQEIPLACFIPETGIPDRTGLRLFPGKCEWTAHNDLTWSWPIQSWKSISFVSVKEVKL